MVELVSALNEAGAGEEGIFRVPPPENTRMEDQDSPSEVFAFG